MCLATPAAAEWTVAGVVGRAAVTTPLPLVLEVGAAPLAAAVKAVAEVIGKVGRSMALLPLPLLLPVLTTGLIAGPNVSQKPPVRSKRMKLRKAAVTATKGSTQSLSAGPNVSHEKGSKIRQCGWPCCFATLVLPLVSLLLVVVVDRGRAPSPFGLKERVA